MAEKTSWADDQACFLEQFCDRDPDKKRKAEEMLEQLVEKRARALLFRDPDSAEATALSNRMIDPYAGFHSTTEEDSSLKLTNATMARKRIHKTGAIDIPGHKTLTSKPNSASQLEFCISLQDYASKSSTIFNSSSKTFLVRKLKPILHCFNECYGGRKLKFTTEYPGKLKMSTFGANKCKHSNDD